MNHILKTTQWEHPNPSLREAAEGSEEGEQQPIPSTNPVYSFNIEDYFNEDESSEEKKEGSTCSDDNDSQNGSPSLPEGWEKKYTSYGRPYYVDHISKGTQWGTPVCQGKHPPIVRTVTWV